MELSQGSNRMVQNNKVSDSGDGLERPKSGSNVNLCESLEEGMQAFIQWLNSEDKCSLSLQNPIVLLKLTNDTRIILYDTSIKTQLEVESYNGVPYCKYCNVDDCAHVGFSIEVEQMFGHRISGNEASVEDLVASS